MDITQVAVDQIRVVGEIDRISFYIGDHPPLVMSHFQAGYLLGQAFAAGTQAVEAMRGLAENRRRIREQGA